MAGINISNLIIQMQQKICATTDERDLLYYAKATQALRSGMIFLADTYNDLPTASTSLGELYWVVSLQTLYIALPAYGWTTVTQKKFYSLWTWGCNNSGPLGDNTATDRSSPVREISSNTTWCWVATANTASLAIRTDGTLWTWGSNTCGVLGDNTTITRSSPVREITSSTTWCSGQTGACNTAAAIKTDGTLWTWGQATCGTLGNNSVTQVSSPVREISSSTNWCAVSLSQTAAAIKTDGTLWSWGCNGSGRVGDNTTICRSSAVQEITKSTTWCTLSVGRQLTSAIKTDGKLWSWGGNSCGQIGNYTNTAAFSSPVQEISGSTIWRSVSVGNSHTMALRTDGSVWGWGMNSKGHIGDNTTIARSSPVREISSGTLWCRVAANYASLAIKTDGTLWTWGCNVCGAVGDNTTIDRSSPVQEISASTTWFTIAAGKNHSLGIKLDCSL